MAEKKKKKSKKTNEAKTNQKQSQKQVVNVNVNSKPKSRKKKTSSTGLRGNPSADMIYRQANFQRPPNPNLVPIFPMNGNELINEMRQVIQLHRNPLPLPPVQATEEIKQQMMTKATGLNEIAKEEKKAEQLGIPIFSTNTPTLPKRKTLSESSLIRTPSPAGSLKAPASTVPSLLGSPVLKPKIPEPSAPEIPVKKTLKGVPDKRYTKQNKLYNEIMESQKTPIKKIPNNIETPIKKNNIQTPIKKPISGMKLRNKKKLKIDSYQSIGLERLFKNLSAS